MNALKPIKELAVIRQDLQQNQVELVLTDEVKKFMELKVTMEAELKATWKALEAYMIEHDVKDLYTLTIAEKRVWKATGTLPPRYYKQILDTSRLNFAADHGDRLPKGASFTMTKYLTKTNRKVEVA